MSEGGKIFYLLMWKNVKLRKYRWFMTSVEILLPILVVYGLCKSSSIIMDSKVKIHNATKEPAVDISTLKVHAGALNLVYTPKSNFTDDFMHDVGQELNTPLMESVFNEYQLEELLLKMYKEKPGMVWMGIVFENGTGGESSKDFVYKIRSCYEWSTDRLFPMDETPGPNKNDPYYFKGFAGLQVGIDATFLKSKMKQQQSRQQRQQDVEYNVKVQPFPYPEYREEDMFRKSVPYVVQLVLIITSMILSIPLISSIIEEKESGVKELMKVMGVREWMIWTTWMVNAFVVSCISYTVVTYFLHFDFNGEHTAAIRHANPLVLWTFIMLYCISHIAFSFIFSAIFHTTAVASSIFMLAMLFITYVSSKVSDLQSLYLIKLSCLFPAGALSQGFSRISYFEMNEMSLSWSSLNTLETNVVGVSLFFVFLMLLFDTCLFLFLTYYITAINPGKFGSKKSPFFIFEQLVSTFSSNTSEELINLEDSEEDKFFEKAPSNLKVSIRIKELYKKFGSMFAVKNVNLDVYDGEITALLGHNGAGKTTAMAILTGMMKPTKGSIIYKNEIDVLRNMDKFRENLGVCPQEDRLFPYLTALQHLLFFGMLKGLTEKEARTDAKRYLKTMEMSSKENNLAATLSGGMKRKLCLSIALTGESETLILDEPTSGMDVESRRKIWDLLLNLRGNRTIILTTHHMEEADALGDRIAIMNQGSIVCHGTPMFLKKAYDTGYQLTLSKLPQRFNREQVSRLVTTAVPQAVKDDESNVEIVYKLPLTETAKFPALFRALEKERNALGIDTMGVSCTTMEQVFLKVGGASIYDHDAGSRKHSTVTDGNLASREYSLVRKKTGMRLILQQLWALLKKKFLYTVQDKMNLFFRIIFPTVILVMLLRGSSSLQGQYSPLAMSLKTYLGSKVMLGPLNPSEMKFRDHFVHFVEASGSQILATNNSDVTEGLLQYGRENLVSFRKDLVVAAALNSEQRIMFYNRWATHSLPVTINTYSNVLLQSTSNDNEQNIVTINHPLEPRSDNEMTASSIGAMIFLYFALAFYTMDLVNYFSTFLVMERVDGFKHIQFMSSLSPCVYWLGTFIADFVFFWIVMIARIVLFKVFDDDFEFLSFDKHFGVLLLIILVYSIAALLFLYVTSSLLRSSKESSYTLTFILNVVCSIIIAVYFAFELSVKNTHLGWQGTLILTTIRFLICIIPPFGFSLIFMKFLYIWFMNSKCSQVPPEARQRCEEMKLSYLEMPSEANQAALLGNLLYLTANIVLYTVFLAVLEMGYFDKLSNWLVNRVYADRHADVDPSTLDPDVKRERDLVRSISSGISRSQSNVASDVVLLTEGLRKRFVRRFKPFTAVADLNMIVKPGECFGLLGVNGAGKSTSFKMLTADLLPSRGDAAINNIKLSEHKTQYLSKAGYCPQTNCFIGELSGRETLSLIASLRGVDESQMKSFVDKWISVVGLENYQNQKCQNYSGGNKRKLCAAMSLIGDPAVVFLDEPTTSVDPVSKRKIYDVMELSKSAGQAVILSSHSMDECETLCDRLTIMSEGQMKCIGTAQHLKQRFAQGFSILIKILDSPNVEQQISTLKNDMMRSFKPEFCVIKDEHKGLLYYQIKDVDLLWSQLFEKMERIKSDHDIVDDYTISDTSLEEVFISFARQKRV